MTEEQIKQKFKETYPDFMRGNEPLSPYFDIWEYAIEIVTSEMQEGLDKIKETCELSLECKQSVFDKQIKELREELEQARKVKIVEHFEAYGQCRDSRMLADLENKLANVSYQLEGREIELKELQKELTEAKELLKWFVWYFREGSPNLVPYKHKVKEAEQFLNSEVEK